MSIDNARRYTHERSTALTLQRTLLPRNTVKHPAVETASRYLPAGARVALVVGDVVGHDVLASAPDSL
ncbi:hypothetical protein [Streptomyces sp. KL118A]|uniref:hypothetical protein n=1 Tax=Streptomyces sp. KL118A TaxID=3045153 RepID=UPI003531C4B7